MPRPWPLHGRHQSLNVYFLQHSSGYACGCWSMSARVCPSDGRSCSRWAGLRPYTGKGYVGEGSYVVAVVSMLLAAVAVVVWVVFRSPPTALLPTRRVVGLRRLGAAVKKCWRMFQTPLQRKQPSQCSRSQTRERSFLPRQSCCERFCRTPTQALSATLLRLCTPFA